MDKVFDIDTAKFFSVYPSDYIPAGGRVFVSFDPAQDDGCLVVTVKGFIDAAGIMHVQEVITNELKNKEG